MSKFHLVCSCTICKKQLTVQNLANHFNKHNNENITKSCPNCGMHHIKSTKFCSRSCANKRIHSTGTKEKIKSSLCKIPKYTKINTRICISCNTIEHSKGRFQSEYCKFCNPSTIYRNSCKFTFNLKCYPEEFNLSLLEKHGMFNPITNPTGVSRDHLLSIDYGKQNKIDASIISHPANCQIILQSDNSKKHNKNSITLDELLYKIQQWDKKYKL